MSNKVRGREKFNRFKPFIIAISKLYCVFPKILRLKLFEYHRMTKGIKGAVIRYALIKSIAINCGDNIYIHPGVYFFSLDKLKLGNNVSVHPMCYIDASGYIEIGNDVSIAHGSTILSTSHIYSDIVVPIKDQGVETKQTIIKDNVWIGSKTTILSGSIIGYGSIIGANAVVTKEVEDNVVVGGVPAKIIKKRN